MAQPFPTENPYLTKGFEPIRFEADCADLAIEGELPRELSGTLYRIGPNPQFAPRAAYNPLLADGMVHAFHIHEQRVAYRNRWVRTQQWTLERAAGRSLFSTSGNPRDADPEVAGLRTDGVANTNLAWHGGRLLALEEGHGPIEIDPVTLDTHGAWNFHAELAGNMTAHPKLDPVTGELVFFANIPLGDPSANVAFYVADSRGVIVRSELIAMPFAALIHDFAISADFVIFFVCPLTVSLERARAGAPVIAWEPELHTHIGVLPRRGSRAEIRWFQGEAAMAWHSMNAFNAGPLIALDVCAQGAAAFPTADGQMPSDTQLIQRLTRWSLDWNHSDTFASQPLCDIACEYPRIDERRCGLPYRAGYVACGGGPGTGDIFHRAIARIDHETGEASMYHAGPQAAVSEPVFVPRSAHADEGDGYLLTLVFDEERNASHLDVLDAGGLERGPLARVRLDHRVPLGFHGLWRPSP
jgi:carotenoid cleavage dioxygenase